MMEKGDKSQNRNHKIEAVAKELSVHTESCQHIQKTVAKTS